MLELWTIAITLALAMALALALASMLALAVTLVVAVDMGELASQATNHPATNTSVINFEVRLA